MKRAIRILVCLSMVSAFTSRAAAEVLFSDNFNADTSASWTQNKAPAANASMQQATWAYDYSAMGIPAAPGSADTLGLRLRANLPIVGGVEVTTRPAGVLSGLSLSPTGKDFGTNYTMTFYAWSNFFGAPNASGLADNAASEGGTNNVLFAVGTSGTVPLVVGNTVLASGGAMDGIAFATTGDGGITNDYRVYPKSGTIVPATTPGVYAAGSTANTNAYYTSIPSLAAHTAPDVQKTLSTSEYGGDAANTQEGSTQAGAFGFAWHQVVITMLDGTVTWDIDDTRIAAYDAGALSLGGNNIALGVSDINTTTARHPSLVFTVFDNLVVSDIVNVMPGDFNNDGSVDAADYTVWRDHLGDPTEGALKGNGDNMNGVDSGDYMLWRDHFGDTSGSGAIVGTPTPEPGSLLIVLLAGCCSCLVRRR